MKYNEVKNALYSKGFKITSIQSGGYLDMVGFEHPYIKGEIWVSFNDDNLEFEDEIDIDYELSEYVMDIPVQTVNFEIDKSISFMSDNTISTSEEDFENVIYLDGEDVDNLFHITLSIVSDKNAYFNFTEQYYEKLKEFNNKIKRFLPVIEKYPFDMEIIKLSGDRNTMFANIEVIFNYYGQLNHEISFEFNVLSWNIRCYTSLFGDSSEFDINCSLEDFENEINNQIVRLNQFYEAAKNF